MAEKNNLENYKKLSEYDYMKGMLNLTRQTNKKPSKLLVIVFMLFYFNPVNLSFNSNILLSCLCILSVSCSKKVKGLNSAFGENLLHKTPFIIFS